MGDKAPPILKWLKGLSDAERERVKSVLSGLDKGDGMAFLSQLLGRPVTEAEYLLVMGELGLKSKKERGEQPSEGSLDWERELKWLYSQVKRRIVMGREIEEREGVPLPSVDKMVEVASRLIEIAFKYKGGEKDIYSFLREVVEGEGSESEPSEEGGE